MFFFLFQRFCFKRKNQNLPCSLLDIFLNALIKHRGTLFEGCPRLGHRFPTHTSRITIVYVIPGHIGLAAPLWRWTPTSRLGGFPPTPPSRLSPSLSPGSCASCNFLPYLSSCFLSPLKFDQQTKPVCSIFFRPSFRIKDKNCHIIQRSLRPRNISRIISDYVLHLLCSNRSCFNQNMTHSHLSIKPKCLTLSSLKI